MLLAVSKIAMDKSVLLAASFGWDIFSSRCCVFFVACEAGAIAAYLNNRVLEDETLQIKIIVCVVPHL